MEARNINGKHTYNLIDILFHIIVLEYQMIEQECKCKQNVKMRFSHLGNNLLLDIYHYTQNLLL